MALERSALLMLTHVVDTVMRSAVQLVDPQAGGSQAGDAFLIRALLVVELASATESAVAPRSIEQAYEAPGMAVMA
jgi:hypothetical protein